MNNTPFTVTGGFDIAGENEPRFDAMGKVVGYTLPDGRYVDLVVALEVVAPDESEYTYVTDTQAMADLGFRCLDYDRLDFESVDGPALRKAEAAKTRRARLQHDRKAAADEAFEQYDFPLPFGESDGWSVMGDFWNRNVYLEDPESPDEPSVRYVFSLTFEEGSALIESVDSTPA